MAGCARRRRQGGQVQSVARPTDRTLHLCRDWKFFRTALGRWRIYRRRGGGFGGGGASGDWGLPEKRKQDGRATRARAGTPRAVITKPVNRVTIVRNGYAYQLDPNAKVREVSGEVDMAKKPSRSRSAQARAGGADRRPTDDGGHYVGARFNGPTDAFNHFAQDAKVNRGRYRAMEDQWARAKAEGKRVWFRIVPVYEGESQRPSLINAWFTINDREHSIQIPNESGKKSDAKQ